MLDLTKDYMTTAAAAAELQVTRWTLNRWIVSGQLDAAKVGPRTVIVKRADVAALVAARK